MISVCNFIPQKKKKQKTNNNQVSYHNWYNIKYGSFSGNFIATLLTMSRYRVNHKISDLEGALKAI